MTERIKKYVPIQPQLGVCYYPEHCSSQLWQSDAQRMKELGLQWVRIGEFAWSRLEPQKQKFQLEWLDEVIEILGNANLKVILGTPTATPPKWILEEYPEMLAKDSHGQVRKFGSRRHYCFSHEGYQKECKRIVEILAKRYGKNPHISAWQIDNEFGCHDTTLSYSDSALHAFRLWLQERYEAIEKLNESWGNVFWSMEYQNFQQVELPHQTTTEANPAHWLDFRRFSSDQVIRFNRLQVEILKQHTQAPILHNFMGKELGFDHFKIGKDLDIASWDSYPLGFLSTFFGRQTRYQKHAQQFMRQGEPDFQDFHHSLYKSVGSGRCWVMEQQPGPVNWASHNPIPLPGMVRLWTIEAFVSGVEVVSYFRWRQARFAQEQMHTGLLYFDNTSSPVLEEIKQVTQDLQTLKTIEPRQNPVAIIFDYESAWAWQTQPQGANFDYFSLAFEFYKALRSLGVNADLVSTECTNLKDYKMLIVPALMQLKKNFKQSLLAYDGILLMGPRTGSKDECFHTAQMPLNDFGIDAEIGWVESWGDEANLPLQNGGQVVKWLEHIRVGHQLKPEQIIETTQCQKPVLLGSQNRFYLTGWLDEKALKRILKELSQNIGIPLYDLPEGLRMTETATHRFLFNYNATPITYQQHTIPSADFLIQPLD